MTTGSNSSDLLVSSGNLVAQKQLIVLVGDLHTGKSEWARRFQAEGDRLARAYFQSYEFTPEQKDQEEEDNGAPPEGSSSIASRTVIISHEDVKTFSIHRINKLVLKKLREGGAPSSSNSNQPAGASQPPLSPNLVPPQPYTVILDLPNEYRTAREALNSAVQELDPSIYRRCVVFPSSSTFSSSSNADQYRNWILVRKLAQQYSGGGGVCQSTTTAASEDSKPLTMNTVAQHLDSNVTVEEGFHHVEQLPLQPLHSAVIGTEKAKRALFVPIELLVTGATFKPDTTGGGGHSNGDRQQQLLDLSLDTSLINLMIKWVGAEEAEEEGENEANCAAGRGKAQKKIVVIVFGGDGVGTKSGAGLMGPPTLPDGSPLYTPDLIHRYLEYLKLTLPFQLYSFLLCFSPSSSSGAPPPNLTEITQGVSASQKVQVSRDSNPLDCDDKASDNKKDDTNPSQQRVTLPNTSNFVPFDEHSLAYTTFRFGIDLETSYLLTASPLESHTAAGPVGAFGRVPATTGESVSDETSWLCGVTPIVLSSTLKLAANNLDSTIVGEVLLDSSFDGAHPAAIGKTRTERLLMLQGSSATKLPLFMHLRDGRVESKFSKGKACDEEEEEEEEEGDLMVVHPFGNKLIAIVRVQGESTNARELQQENTDHHLPAFLKPNHGDGQPPVSRKETQIMTGGDGERAAPLPPQYLTSLEIIQKQVPTPSTIQVAEKYIEMGMVDEGDFRLVRYMTTPSSPSGPSTSRSSSSFLVGVAASCWSSNRKDKHYVSGFLNNGLPTFFTCTCCTARVGPGNMCRHVAATLLLCSNIKLEDTAPPPPPAAAQEASSSSTTKTKTTTTTTTSGGGADEVVVSAVPPPVPPPNKTPGLPPVSFVAMESSLEGDYNLICGRQIQVERLVASAKGRRQSISAALSIIDRSKMNMNAGLAAHFTGVKTEGHGITSGTTSNKFSVDIKDGKFPTGALPPATLYRPLTPSYTPQAIALAPSGLPLHMHHQQQVKLAGRKRTKAPGFTGSEGRASGSGTKERVLIREAVARGPNAPKRPLTPFFYYSKTAREEVHRALPPGTSAAQLAVELGKKWREMDPEVKKKYVEESRADKERFQAEWEAYITTDEYKEYVARPLAVAAAQAVTHTAAASPGNTNGGRKRATGVKRKTGGGVQPTNLGDSPQEGGGPGGEEIPESVAIVEAFEELNDEWKRNDDGEWVCEWDSDEEEDAMLLSASRVGGGGSGRKRRRVEPPRARLGSIAVYRGDFDDDVNPSKASGLGDATTDALLPRRKSGSEITRDGTTRTYDDTQNTTHTQLRGNSRLLLASRTRSHLGGL